MIIGEDAVIQLKLEAEKYLSSARQVSLETGNMEKTVDSVMARVEKQAGIAAAKYQLFGNESQLLSSKARSLESALNRLTTLGLDPQSAEVQKLKGEYDRVRASMEATETKSVSLKDKMLDSAKAYAAGFLALETVKKGFEFGKAAIEEYTASVEVFNKLNAAFVATGDSSQVAARGLADYAGKLMLATNIEDDEIMSAEALLHSITGLDENGIKQIIPGIVDMSKALGLDLDTATKQVASALEGGRNSLSKFGIEVDKGAPKVDKLASLAEQLGQKWGGAAAAMAADNPYKAMGMQLGELNKSIGELLAYEFKPLTKSITKAVSDAAENMHKQNVFEKVKAGDLIDLASLDTAIEVERQRIKDFQAELGVSGKNTAWLSTIEKEQNQLIAFEEKRRLAQKQLSAEGLAAYKAEKEAAAAVAAENAKIDALLDYRRHGHQSREATDEQYAIKQAEDAFKEYWNSWKEGDEVIRQGLSWQETEFDKYIAQWDEGDVKVSNYTRAIKKLSDEEQARYDLAKDQFASITEAMGAAIVTGEDGWKAYAKAGLNAIAAVAEALAKEMIVRAGASIATPWLAAAYVAGAAAAYVAAGAIRAIPMAEGGDFMVTKPTYFLAGEAGPERATFTPQGRSGPGGITIIQNIAGSVLAERQLRQMAVGAVAVSGRGY